MLSLYGEEKALNRGFLLDFYFKGRVGITQIVIAMRRRKGAKAWFPARFILKGEYHTRYCHKAEKKRR